MARLAVSIILILVLLIASGGVIGLAVKFAKKPPRAAIEATVLTVEAIPLQRRDVVEQVRGYGAAQPSKRAIVAAQVSDLLREVPGDLREGERVTEGQVLARLDTQRLDAEVSRANAMVAEAEADIGRMATEITENRRKLELIELDVQVAQNDFDRINRLFEEGASSISDVDRTRTALQNAEQRASDQRRALSNITSEELKANARLELRQADLAVARWNRERADIVAPFSGVIERRHADPGVLLRVGDPVFTILNDARIEIPISIPALQSVGVQAGAVVSLESDEATPRHWEGEVTRLSPSVGAQSRTVVAYAMLENSDEQRIAAGMFLLANVAGRTFSDVYAIPRNAIVDGGIYLVQEGLAHRHHPQWVVQLDDLALTRDEIPEGALLVTSGFELLYDGAPVRVLRTAREGTTELPSDAGIAP